MQSPNIDIKLSPITLHCIKSPRSMTNPFYYFKNLGKCVFNFLILCKKPAQNIGTNNSKDYFL